MSVSKKEIGLLWAVLIAVHLLLWARGLPLPHPDAGSYLEPAWLLARDGFLRCPASQNIDRTLTLGYFIFFPGNSLLLGGWLKAFGLSVDSQLAFTHLFHTLWLGALYLVIRLRLNCARLASWLAIASCFPFFYHGRPDVTALAFGALAWLAAPTAPGGWKRRAGAGALLGAAVLISPSFGISSAACVGCYCLLASPSSLAGKAREFLLLSGTAILTVALVTIAVWQWQNAWKLAPIQMHTNTAVRGGELNANPNLLTVYGLLWCIVPLGLLTLAPLLACLCALGRQRRFADSLWIVSLSYLGGWLIWFALNRAELLLKKHFFLLARPAFHGLLASSPAPLARTLGILILLAMNAIVAFTYKDNALLYAGRNLRVDYARGQKEIAAMTFDLKQVVAVDSCYFSFCYRTDRTINYDMFRMMHDHWRRTGALTPAWLLARVPAESRDAPLPPDIILASACSLNLNGLPDPKDYELIKGSLPVTNARIFGRTIQSPSDPLQLYVFQRRR